MPPCRWAWHLALLGRLRWCLIVGSELTCLIGGLELQEIGKLCMLKLTSYAEVFPPL